MNDNDEIKSLDENYRRIRVFGFEYVDAEDYARIQRQNELLRAVASATQWLPDEFLDCCPLCNGDKRDGHAADCLYQAAIEGGALE